MTVADSPDWLTGTYSPPPVTLFQYAVSDTDAVTLDNVDASDYLLVMVVVYLNAGSTVPTLTVTGADTVTKIATTLTSANLVVGWWLVSGMTSTTVVSTGGTSGGTAAVSGVLAVEIAGGTTFAQESVNVEASGSIPFSAMRNTVSGTLALLVVANNGWTAFGLDTPTGWTLFDKGSESGANESFGWGVFYQESLTGSVVQGSVTDASTGAVNGGLLQMIAQPKQ